jgi:regulation of enolase protein 1 (concanavalin A-like superfamily)
MAGDGVVSAQITSQSDIDPWAKAGLMFRGSNDPGAPYFAILTTPETNGTVIQYRATQGAATSQVGGVTAKAPLYMKISRSASTFSAFTSPDGVTWTAFPGSTVSIASMTGSLLGGMADTSHSQFHTSTTAFANFTFTPASGLPSPWVDQDVGNPTPAGSASYSNGVFTLNGGGNDIWGTLDQFNYTDQTLSGNGTITARVTSQTNTSAWAKAGVMIKQSTTAGSNYALLGVTPGNGISFQYNFNNAVAGGSYTFPGAWVRLTRAGSTITAYTSADGSVWMQVGTATVALTDPITVGLFDTSHNAGALSTATFDNVSVQATTSTLPVPWVDTDVGSPAKAGSASYAGGVFTINGAGADIWGTVDQFNYVYQTLTGNASIIARVTSQSLTDTWSKSGVMIKQSTTSGSAYALLAATEGNGITFQASFNTAVAGGPYTFPNAWLKLTRSGSTITAYDSADGVTWNLVGSSTVALTDPVTIGFFVCSHSANNLNTSTFDNVSVTP